MGTQAIMAMAFECVERRMASMFYETYVNDLLLVMCVMWEGSHMTSLDKRGRDELGCSYEGNKALQER